MKRQPVHGGDLGEVRRRHPEAPLPWIDLSTGINPHSYPVPALAPEVWTRLPSLDGERALIEEAAKRYGVDDLSTIVAAPGTQALIQLLPRLVAKTRVAIVGPTYDEHEASWRLQGHDVSIVSDLPSAAGADVIVLVNPDNPTGRLVPVADLRALKAMLVVDEAFIDLHPREASLVADLPPRAIVLRSFGKTYGLAGVRLGFAVAGLKFAEQLREELGPWPVSGPALEIGRLALGDTLWLRQMAVRLEADSKKLDALLLAAGFSLIGGTRLFRLVRHREAGAIAETLARQGVYVRTFPQKLEWLRFGLPATEHDYSRLEAALS